MKKFLLLLVLCGFGLFALSCKGEDKTPDSLEGTSWVATQQILTATYTTTLTFTDKEFTAVTKNGSGSVQESFSGTYLYDTSSAVVILSDENGEKMTGTVSGKKMTVKEDGVTTVFTKQ